MEMYAYLLMILSISNYPKYTLAKKFDACHSSTDGVKREIAVTEEWFKWGQLYAYCMQTSTAAFDSECSTDACQQCMKPCSTALPYNVTNCLSSCKSMGCQRGCKFYDVLVNKGSSIVAFKAENFTVNASRVPKIINGTIAERETLNNIHYQWTSIASSLFLVTITVANADKTVKNENVLYLTSDLQTSLNVKAICDNISPVRSWSEGTQFRISVYPINMNGYNRTSIVMKSSYRVKEFSPVSQVVIGKPYYKVHFAAKFQWNVTVIWFEGITAAQVQSSWLSSECQRKIRGRASRQSFRYSSKNKTQFFYVPEREAEGLENCTAQLKISSYNNCLVSPIILYRNITVPKLSSGIQPATPTKTTELVTTTTEKTTTPSNAKLISSSLLLVFGTALFVSFM